MQGIPQGPSSQPSSGGSSQKPSLSWQSPTPAKPSHTPKPPAPKANEKTSQTKSNMSTYIGIFIAGLIVGGLLGSALTGQRLIPGTSNATSTASTTNNTTDLGSALGGLQGLAIDSGQDAGVTVAVSHVSVDKPTWVVIYDDESGMPGRALGAQLFFPASDGGETSGTVTLIRNTLAGHDYLAGERIDDGDHAYGPASDKLITDANSAPLTLKFSIK